MTLIIELQPEIERGLLAQAQEKGVSLAEHAREILVHASIGRTIETPPGIPGTASEAKNLYELFAPVRGLLTDEEIDLYFRRTPSVSRPVDFE